VVWVKTCVPDIELSTPEETQAIQQEQDRLKEENVELKKENDKIQAEVAAGNKDREDWNAEADDILAEIERLTKEMGLVRADVAKLRDLRAKRIAEIKSLNRVLAARGTVAKKDCCIEVPKLKLALTNAGNSIREAQVLFKRKDKSIFDLTVQVVKRDTLIADHEVFEYKLVDYYSREVSFWKAEATGWRWSYGFGGYAGVSFTPGGVQYFSVGIGGWVGFSKPVKKKKSKVPLPFRVAEYLVKKRR
jgi:hypothetical protein